MTNEPKARLLRPAEAARLLAISRPQIYKLAHSGAIRAVSIAGSIRIPADELERVIQFGTTAPEQAAE